MAAQSPPQPLPENPDWIIRLTCMQADLNQPIGSPFDCTRVLEWKLRYLDIVRQRDSLSAVKADIEDALRSIREWRKEFHDAIEDYRRLYRTNTTPGHEMALARNRVHTKRDRINQTIAELSELVRHSHNW